MDVRPRSIAIAVTLTPAVFLLLALLRRDRRALLVLLASAVTCTGIGFLIAPAHFSDDLVRYDPPHWNLLAVLASGAYVSWAAATLVVLARLHLRQGDGNHSISGEERPLTDGDRASQAAPSPLPQPEQSPVLRPAAAVRRTGAPLRRGGLRRGPSWRTARTLLSQAHLRPPGPVR